MKDELKKNVMKAQTGRVGGASFIAGGGVLEDATRVGEVARGANRQPVINPRLRSPEEKRPV